MSCAAVFTVLGFQIIAKRKYRRKIDAHLEFDAEGSTRTAGRKLLAQSLNK
jgi:hypothetical protein